MNPMPLSSVSGQHVVLPLDGSKYFFKRFTLSSSVETDILADAMAALPFGVIRVRLNVDVASGAAACRIAANGSPALAVNGKDVFNVFLGASAIIVQPWEAAMLFTSLVALQIGETSCDIEVEYWSGQS